MHESLVVRERDRSRRALVAREAGKEGFTGDDLVEHGVAKSEDGAALVSAIGRVADEDTFVVDGSWGDVPLEEHRVQHGEDVADSEEHLEAGVGVVGVRLVQHGSDIPGVGTELTHGVEDGEEGAIGGHAVLAFVHGRCHLLTQGEDEAARGKGLQGLLRARGAYAVGLVARIELGLESEDCGGEPRVRRDLRVSDGVHEINEDRRPSRGGEDRSEHLEGLARVTSCALVLDGVKYLAGGLRGDDGDGCEFGARRYETPVEGLDQRVGVKGLDLLQVLLRH